MSALIEFSKVSFRIFVFCLFIMGPVFVFAFNHIANPPKINASGLVLMISLQRTA